MSGPTHGPSGRPARGPVIVVGAGGHARPVMEALGLLGVRIAGVLDDAPGVPPVLGHAVTGRPGELSAMQARGLAEAVVAVGDWTARHRLAELVRDAGLGLPLLVHPTAIVSPHATLGEGTQVLARAVIGPEARVGQLGIVNTGAIVEHGCVVGDGVHVAPGAILLGGVTIGDGVVIGAGSVVLPGVRVGAGAVVAAGSVVTRDVAEAMVVAGSPARPLRA